MIPPFAWVGELVPFFLRWGHKSQHVCHNVHKKLLVRSLFYTCIYFELTKHLGCGFKVIKFKICTFAPDYVYMCHCAYTKELSDNKQGGRKPWREPEA